MLMSLQQRSPEIVSCAQDQHEEPPNENSNRRAILQDVLTEQAAMKQILLFFDIESLHVNYFFDIPRGRRLGESDFSS